MLKEFQKTSILKLNSDATNQILYFFGAKHSNDPNDPQFNNLKECFDEFLSITKEDNNIVFVERLVQEIPQKYQDAILTDGESGAIKWLAKKKNIEIMCPELDGDKERKLLCSLFESDLVAYAMIIQNLSAWHQTGYQEDFKNVINYSVKREIEFAKIYNFIPNIIWFYNKHEERFGNQALKDKKFLYLISDPRKDYSEVNTIIAKRTKIRNESILSMIKKYWKLRKSIFIIYGKGHLVTLRPLIEEVLKN